MQLEGWSGWKRGKRREGEGRGEKREREGREGDRIIGKSDVFPFWDSMGLLTTRKCKVV